MKENSKNHKSNVFDKAMETTDFVYYMDDSEGDDNGSVRMYDKESGRLVSDNFMANRDLYENLLYFNYEWINETLRYARTCMVEELKIDLAKEFFLENKTKHHKILGPSQNSKNEFNQALENRLGFTLSKNDFKEMLKQLNVDINLGLHM